MSASTNETVKLIGMKDASLFRQQVYINGKWSDADNGITLNSSPAHDGQCRLKFPLETSGHKLLFSEVELIKC